MNSPRSSPFSHSHSLDLAFTERILGLPVENYKSYVEADATQRARHIPSNSFFLMHGLSDFSAPFVHGTKLARALTEAGILFRYQVRRCGGWVGAIVNELTCGTRAVKLRLLFISYCRLARQLNVLFLF